MNTEVARKVRLDKYERVAVIGAPEGYQDTLGDDVSFSLTAAPFDLCLAFVFSLEEMTRFARQAAKDGIILPGGVLLFAYPKANNKVYPAIGRDDIFPTFGIDPDGDGIVPDTSLSFNLMVKLDDVFTIIGLKNMAGQRRPSETRPSQIAADYEAKIPELRARLESSPEILTFFDGLTPGYKRNWARFVFSAVKEKTKNSRFEKMKRLLEAGKKTI